MTPQDYYNYFESRPQDKWTTGTMADKDGNYCAVGWIRFGLQLYKFESDLKQMFRKWDFGSPEEVNDGTRDTKIYGASPRERILTVLSQIVLFENAEVNHDRSEVAPVVAPVVAEHSLALA